MKVHSFSGMHARMSMELHSVSHLLTILGSGKPVTIMRKIEARESLPWEWLFRLQQLQQHTIVLNCFESLSWHGKSRLASQFHLLSSTSLGQNWNFPYQKMTNKLSRKLQELTTISWLENDRETKSFISIYCSVKLQLCKTLSSNQSLMKMFYFRL
jgi:hypothetical protein